MKFVGSDASARVPPNSRDSATPCSFRHRCHVQTHCSCAFKSNGSAQTQKQSLVRHALVSAKRRRHNTRVSVQCTELATTIFAVDDGDAVRRKPLVQDLFRECGLFEVGQSGQCHAIPGAVELPGNQATHTRKCAEPVPCPKLESGRRTTRARNEKHWRAHRTRREIGEALRHKDAAAPAWSMAAFALASL